MDNGFKIICLACGKEVILKELPGNDGIDIYLIGYDGEICVACDCGNTIED